jgi:RNA polymerase sigma-70 factor, ECF subfamily
MNQDLPNQRNAESEFASDAEWDSFILGLAHGQPGAYEEFWRRYGNRLNGVAKKHFPAGLQRRLAPEDIVQSTCRSFFARIVDGRLAVSDADSLWGLLCAITLNKTRMKQRFHLAKRRNLSRERDVEKKDGSEAASIAEPSLVEQTPEESMIFAEQLEQIMKMLDPIEQEVLQLKLDNHTHEEIAEKVRRSDRTVRRVLQRLQEKLLEAIASEKASS